ncbi:esterase [Mixta calida]|uniref:esterase n=1 Tax=Mixta calida TaxID=665913 RepID=UPI000535CB27|nr:esterase [Mixta calida]AIX74443.1 acyl-CoA esterase [Pantoea sp. PSNIH2]POU51019.1 alpha/beta hydrolase [Pantoea sp. PSNIH5]POU68854.1 alpha/beta hydrolase [Pantoea sp. PSNIH4]POY68833.1 alpha/beta hydrolase [Pantoea sp. PSNIH3]MDU4290850.1 esterase [Mixta calida]
MNLNTRLQTEQSVADATPVLLIHGLFGSLDNLGVLARGLKADRPLIQVDVRNHGLSPRSEEMSYRAMAQDMLETLDRHDIDKVTVIGHSMGGKIAMTMTALAPERIEQLVLIDIAPVDYQTRRHDAIFAAVNAVTAAGVTQRSAAAEVMREIITEEGVIQFLLKSFFEGEWRFNVPALWANYSAISGWETVPSWSGPALFIRGGLSPYLDDIHRNALLAQFPQARAHVIAGAGHWVHAEKPDAVLRAVRRFLAL